MSSSRALCYLPSVKKQNMTSRFASLTEQDIEKVVEDKDSQTQKGRRRRQRSCLLTLSVKEKNLREPEEKKQLAQTLKTFLICRNEKERIRSMFNNTIIRFGFCDIQNNQVVGKGYQPQPSTWADNPYLDLDYSGYHKNLILTNNCLLTNRLLN